MLMNGESENNSNQNSEENLQQVSKKTINDKKVAKNDLNNKENPKTKKQIDEETVIEKIKNFIAKIVAMQEETERKIINENEENEEIDQKKEDKTIIKYMPEYYDLPYRYNETIVKILAQTPKKLFVYWDVSDNDIEKYVKTFGDDFLEKTYPVLLLYNEDMKYVKEIQINDFANSWYIDIQDPKTKYTIQLGRKFKGVPTVDYRKVQENEIVLKTDYLPFANSNVLEVPNDHVLFEYLPRFITFKNVKTNEEYTKDLKSFKDVFGRNYRVDKFYEEQYKDEISEGIFDMANPSSKLSSSTFK